MGGRGDTWENTTRSDREWTQEIRKRQEIQSIRFSPKSSDLNEDRYIRVSCIGRGGEKEIIRK
jgi:hypothetical protein